MAKLGLRRGPEATAPVLSVGELALKLDRKKLVTSVDGVNNITLSPLQIWDQSTLYLALEDLVVFGGQIYQCNTEHTSSVFATDSANWTLVTKPGQRVVADIAGRDALAGHDLFEALACYVIDASADTTVTSGAALYVYSSSAWVKISEFESLDVTIDDAAEGTKGIIEIATSAEMATGTEDLKAVTPLKVREVTGDVATLTTTATDLSGAVNEINSGLGAKVDSTTLDLIAGTREDLYDFNPGIPSYKVTDSLLNTNVGMTPIGVVTLGAAEYATDGNDLTAAQCSQEDWAGVKSDSLIDIRRIKLVMQKYTVGKFIIQGLLVQNGEATPGNWEDITWDSIDQVIALSSIEGDNKTIAMGSTGTKTEAVVTRSGPASYYGIRAYCTATSGNPGSTQLLTMEGYELDGVQDPTSNLVRSVNLLKDEVGNSSLLAEGSASLVEEINLKATQLELNNGLNTRLDTSETGVRSELYSFDPSNVGYESTDYFLTGGTAIGNLGVVANAFDGLDGTGALSGVPDQYVGKKYDNTFNIGRFNLVMATTVLARFKLQGLTAQNGEATPSNWDDITPTAISGVDADKWDIENTIEINNNAPQGMATLQHFSVTTSNTTNYYGYRLVVLQANNSVSFNVRTFEANEPSGVADPTTTFVSSINDLNANKADKGSYVTYNTSASVQLVVGEQFVSMDATLAGPREVLLPDSSTLPAGEPYYVYITCYSLSNGEVLTVKSFGSDWIFEDYVMATERDGAIFAHDGAGNWEVLASNDLTTKAKVEVLGQPDDLTIESAVPANAAVLTYGPNLLTAINTGLAASLVDDVVSAATYSQVNTGARLVITFSQARALRRVDLNTWNTSDWGGAFKVQFSDDGTNWTDASGVLNLPGYTVTPIEYELASNGSHIYWALFSTDIFLFAHFNAFEGLTFDSTKSLKLKDGALSTVARKTRTDSNTAVTILANDEFVRLNASGAGASQTASLPEMSSVYDGKLITVVGLGTNTYPALVNAAGSSTVLGGDVTINNDGQSFTFLGNLVNNNWEVVSTYNPSAGGVTVQNNFAGTTAPSVTNDASEGYAVGSAWLDITSSPAESYRCADATIGAAVWIKTSLTYDELPSSRATVSYNSASGNTTYAVTDKVMVINMAGTDNVQLTLNPSSGYPDEFKIKRLGSGTGTITLLPDGVEEIDGATGLFDASPFINTAGSSVTLVPVTNGFVLA